MFQKFDLKHNRNEVMIHLLFFTAYFTEHCDSLTSPSNTQTRSGATSIVPLLVVVAFLKFLLAPSCKMKIQINPHTKKCLDLLIQSGK